MSTNQVPDIGEMYDFYKLRDEMIDALKCQKAELLNSKKGCLTCDDLINKIESLGKDFNKENENENGK